MSQAADAGRVFTARPASVVSVGRRGGRHRRRRRGSRRRRPVLPRHAPPSTSGCTSGAPSSSSSRGNTLRAARRRRRRHPGARHRARLARRRITASPAARVFEWALILPLAMPAYVIGFAFLGLFDFAGPAADRAAPLASATGAAPARDPLVRRRHPDDDARLLPVRLPARPRGVPRAGRGRRWRPRAASAARASSHSSRVTLPLARPSLVAGAALAMMEALADFGTVATFGYRTLHRGDLSRLVRDVRPDRGDPARQRAAALRARAARCSSGARAAAQRFTQSDAARPRRPRRVPLARLARAGGHRRLRAPCSRWPSCCPWASSRWWAIERGARGPRRRATSPRSSPIRCSLAALAAAAACVLAVVLAYAGRLHPSRGRPGRRAVRVDGLRAARLGHRGRRPAAARLGRPRRWRAARARRSAGRSGCCSPARRSALVVRLRRALPRREPADGGREPHPHLRRSSTTPPDRSARGRAARCAACTCR